jgi:diguanylate cyclase (GGDEF)-like protein
MDDDLKKYADTIYESARMESARILRQARADATQGRAGLDRGDLPLSGLDIRAMLGIFDDHIERCLVARFESYQRAYTEGGRTPTEREFADILSDCQAVRAEEVRHSASAVQGFIGSRAMVGVPVLNIKSMLGSSSGHAYDRVLEKLKIWKAKTGLILSPAKTEVAIKKTKKTADVLLPTYNRSEFDQDLRGLLSNGGVASPVAVVFMDLDNFKSINDGPGGHQAGDRALIAFAEAVLRACKGKGNAYRYGGDELCVLLPNHSVEEALAVAERIRREVRAIRTDELADGLNTSIGVACFPESTEDREKLVSFADAAMYASKKAGGNRVSRSESSASAR